MKILWRTFLCMMVITESASMRYREFVDHLFFVHYIMLKTLLKVIGSLGSGCSLSTGRPIIPGNGKERTQITF
jgi:hypothetical protein